MHYKTICLEMIQQRPQLTARLRAEKGTLRAVETCASALKEYHEVWKRRLTAARPQSDPGQIASQAMELAVAAMQEALPSELPPSDADAWSLDAAMASLLRPTPSA